MSLIVFTLFLRHEYTKLLSLQTVSAVDPMHILLSVLRNRVFTDRHGTTPYSTVRHTTYTNNSVYAVKTL